MAKHPAPLAGKLLIHTGDHKTGTTSIQHALTRGDVTLPGGRIAYPLGKHHFNHNGLAGRERGRFFFQPKRSVVRDEPFKGFARRALAEQADLTVLSAENLEAVDPRALARALARHLTTAPGQLTVTTYLRPHIPRVISGLAEHIKLGWSAENPWNGVEAGARARRKYTRRLAAWRTVFGDAYKVRPMIRAELTEGSVLKDLIATALGPGVATFAPEHKSNESLGIEDLMRLHVVHRALPDLGRATHHALGWMLAEQIDTLRPAGGASTRLRPHKGLATRLRSAFRGDAATIDSDWFGGRALLAQALDEAADTAVSERMPLQPEAWLTTAEIAALKERAAEYGALTAEKGWKAKYMADRLARIKAATSG
ncbi:hypothetical protein [Sinisalibacter aestuarii]|uniref:Uncharacterized protein n=1 Tax=Sinisalibacter aestuarii TaxID=2949426 RepID=A0ABQ5LSK5_9RHOB|nr:hypothetical protein [Sinisalibacter aestuarii]GKY87975.1 hypothetical protein STA1M1_18440 [Sinisalibacter aestuarii]